MKSKIAKLIDVKSIVTLLLTVVFCILSVCCLPVPTAFLSIYTMIIGFYFGTQTQKAKDTASGGYNGPQQAQTLPQGAEPIYETVDSDVANDVHPPDAEPMAKVGFEY